MLRDASEDVRAAWGRAAAQAIDYAQNSGWLAGGIDQCVADTNGVGLKLNAQPDADVLGWSDDYKAEWTKRVERRFRKYCNSPYECDLQGKMTIPAMADAAIRWHYAYGEAVALLPLRRRLGAESALKVLMVPPTRLVQDTREFERIYQGIRVDGDGMPKGYLFRRRTATGMPEEVEIEARDAAGRPNVIHVFDGDPTQMRGITPLAPVLKVVAQYDQLSDATLTATLLQTIFAATLKSSSLSERAFDSLMTADDDDGSSPAVPDDVMAYFQARGSFYGTAKIDLGAHGRINSLFPGDELEFHNSEHPSDNYLPFSSNLLREIARCIGITYENFSLNYEAATYSSVRMGTSAIWNVTLRRRARIAVPFMQAIYDAWLEEEVGEGRIDFPGGYQAFLRNRSAASAAEWQGPPKPTADDLKTAKAQGERLERGVTSLSYECAEYGLDWQDVMLQRADEKRFAEAQGLPDPHLPKGFSPDLSTEPGGA